jgi:sec-independent protein translocase protein TatA
MTVIGVGHLWELVIVLVLALIFFGPKRLPELGSGLGQSIRAFRKATSEDLPIAEESVPQGLPQVGAAVGRTIGGVKAGLDGIVEDTGITQMRQDVRAGLAHLREESGIDEVRRELGSLEGLRR